MRVARSRRLGGKTIGVHMGDVLSMMSDIGKSDSPSPFPGRKSADVDSPLEGIGQELCKARQRNGKVLKDVCRELKILPRYLLAIEKSQFEALPGRVYAIGYVRSYAAYLGLDAETFVARLKGEMGSVESSQADVTPLLASEQKAKPEALPFPSGESEESGIGLSL